MLHYRPMEIADYQQVLALWQTAPGVRGLESRDEVDRILQRNPGLSRLAEFTSSDAQSTVTSIVGAMLVCHDGRRGYLYHLAVDPAFRRQGIARKIVEQALDGLSREGISRCSIYLIDSNDEGHQFWRSMGFRLRDDLVLMAIDLPQSE